MSLKIKFLPFTGLLFSSLSFAYCPPIEIKVSLTPKPLVVLDTFSYSAMQSQNRMGGAAVSGKQKTMGLYLAKNQVSTNIKTALSLKDGSFQACAEKAEIDITYDQTIYIASEIPKRTCTYKVAYEHELTHAHIQYEASKMALSAIKDLNKVGGNSVEAPTEALARRSLDAYAQWLSKAAEATLSGHVRPAQERLDTPASYIAETQKCGAETQTILQSLR